MRTESWEEVLVRISGTLVHLIDREKSVELACGEFSIVRLWQGQSVVAILARVGDKIQWPLAKDEAAVKLDECHYFFNLRVPSANATYDDEIMIEREGVEFLNYGLTIASKGQDELLKELDGVLEHYSNFSSQEVSQAGETSEVLNGSPARETSPGEMDSEKKREMGERSTAYWTTLAPNVEDYCSSVARMIASGSAQLIKGILWCGDVTVDRLKWGDGFLRERMGPGSRSEINPETVARIQRVKFVTEMSEAVATEVLSGVVHVSGILTGSLVNSSAGKKFFSRPPGEIVLASLEGFSKVVDAIELAGKNVMSTTSVVTTGLVSQRYGAAAGQATNQGFSAAGHALGAVWAVLKMRAAINPKAAMAATTTHGESCCESKAPLC